MKKVIETRQVVLFYLFKIIALLLKLFIVEREWFNYGKFNFLYFLLICRILASHAEAHLNKRFKCVIHM